MRATLFSTTRTAHEWDIHLPHGSLRCALLRSKNIPFVGRARHAAITPPVGGVFLAEN